MSRVPQAALDAAFLIVLEALALLAFHGTFLGWSYLVVGVVGIALGAAVVTLLQRWNQPVVLSAAAVVVLYFLLGGAVTLHSLGGTYLLPTPRRWGELAGSLLHGWKDLLTTLPPVDDPRLLALPFVLGLVAGAIGVVVATRASWLPAPLLVPVALLVLVILLGVESPARTAIDAAAFAAVAVSWLVLRSRRARNLQSASTARRTRRRLIGATLCIAAAAAGFGGGAHLPGVAGQRVVFRTHVVPPFDVGQYPSPLAQFRRFTKGYADSKTNALSELYDKPLFEVTGVKSGTPLRIAALDSYNGVVWGAGNVAGSAGEPLAPDSTDVFQKVSRVIENPAARTGAPVTGRVRVLTDALGSGWVWLPGVGDLTGITFRSPDELDGSTVFRYNLDSATGVLPGDLLAHADYRFTAVQPDDQLTPGTRLASGALPGVASQTQFQRLAASWAGHAETPLQQVLAVAAYLKHNGHLTDGQGEFQGFTAGHSLYRLTFFTQTTGELAGDGEQFAAILALMANALGAPARVVMTADVPASHIVRGRDVHAVVELEAVDGTWRTLPDSAFLPTTPPEQQQQLPQQTVAASVIPPPAPVHPPATAGEPLDNTLNHRAEPAKKHSSLHLPSFVLALLRYVGIPLLVILLLCFGVVGLKAWRRARRRSRGSTTRRLGAAWREVLDQARDFGHVTPARATRREQAAATALAEVAASARLADAAMFGREAPSEETVASYWAHVDELRRTITRRHDRWSRLRAALNLTTLRVGRQGTT